MATKLIYLIIITISFSLGLFFRSINEFTTFDIITIISIILILLIVEAFLIFYFSKRKPLFLIITTLFIVLNIFCIRVLLIDDFAALSWFLQLIIFITALFIVYANISAIEENELWGKLVTALWLFIIIADISSAVYDYYKKQNSSLRIENDTTLSFQDKKAINTLKNIQSVTFNKKPNIYIVFLDSLVPKSLAKKHMNVDKFAYHDAFENNFKMFSNIFANAIPTTPSLNSTLSLDPRYFSNLNDIDKFKLVTGHTPSPLFQIFKANNYTTNAVFKSSYYGSDKGQYLDYLHNYDKTTTLCDFFTEGYSPIMLFGYCKLMHTEIGQKLLAKITHQPLLKATTDELNFLINKYRTFSNNGVKPDIFISTTYTPGHTPGGYRNKDKQQRASYIAHHINEAQQTAKIITRLVSFIDEQKEESILLIFGDHGPWLSRGMSPESNQKFFVQDRYAVMGGIYPPQICSKYLNIRNVEAYTTISEIMRNLVKCLSGGKDPLNGKVEYRISELSNL